MGYEADHIESVKNDGDDEEEIEDKNVKTVENERDHEPLKNELNEVYCKPKVLMHKPNHEHFLSKIPATEKKKWPQKPCVYCRKYGTRHDTRYICSLCNVALCKDTCFSDYHS